MNCLSVAATIVLVPAILSGCLEQVAFDQHDRVTCGTWAEMTDGEQVAFADRLIGNSANLLERVRIRQHQPAGTTRESLIADVSGSITKTCMAPGTTERPVREVMDALYQ